MHEQNKQVGLDSGISPRPHMPRTEADILHTGATGLALVNSKLRHAHNRMSEKIQVFPEDDTRPLHQRHSSGG